MSEENLKPGDVVELKSGGPAMTVKGTAYGTEGLICSWFDGKKVQEREFEPAQLKRRGSPEAPSVVGP